MMFLRKLEDNEPVEGSISSVTYRLTWEGQRYKVHIHDPESEKQFDAFLEAVYSSAKKKEVEDA